MFGGSRFVIGVGVIEVVKFRSCGSEGREGERRGGNGKSRYVIHRNLLKFDYFLRELCRSFLRVKSMQASLRRERDATLQRTKFRAHNVEIGLYVAKGGFSRAL